MNSHFFAFLQGVSKEKNTSRARCWALSNTRHAYPERKNADKDLPKRSRAVAEGIRSQDQRQRTW